MSKETTRQKSPAGAKRKLTRAEKKEIAAIIQRAKGDGKPHTAQQTIPYVQMYPDGICKVSEKKYSKSIVFEDINYQLAQADDKTAIFENWCDFLNYFDASVSVQLSFINQGARKETAQEAIQIPQQDDAFNSIRAVLVLPRFRHIAHEIFCFKQGFDVPGKLLCRIPRLRLRNGNILCLFPAGDHIVLPDVIVPAEGSGFFRGTLGTIAVFQCHVYNCSGSDRVL